jgi:hypothetical protein
VNDDDLRFIKLVLLSHGSTRARAIADKIDCTFAPVEKPVEKKTHEKPVTKKPYRTKPDYLPFKG